MTPGKTPFDRAVHAQQTSSCIQWQVQALRALRSAPVLPRSGCRRGGKRSFEKPILSRYEEDEVRCRFIMREAAISAWDFDVYVEPRYRLGRTMALLWMGAETRMRDEGVQWTFSRISEFNAESLAAHARLGAQPVARALFLLAGPWQLALFNCRPFIHLSLRSGSAPTLVVAPPFQPLSRPP